MTANHEHTPTDYRMTSAMFRVLIERLPTDHVNIAVHKQVLDDFDRMIDATIAAAEQRGAVKALRYAADIKLGNGYYEMLFEDELNTLADQMEGDDE